MKREIAFAPVERVAVAALFWKLRRLVAEAQRDYEANLLAILRERGLEAVPQGAALVQDGSGFRGLVWDDGLPEPQAPAPTAEVPKPSTDAATPTATA